MSDVFNKPSTKKFKELLQDISNKNNLHDSLLNTFLNIPEFPDIEYVLKSLNDLTTFSNSEGGIFLSHISNSIPNHNMIIYHKTSYKYSDIINEIENLKSTIEDQVFEKYSWDHEKDELLTKIFDPIFDVLDVIDNDVRVVTTNYDQAIEVYCSQHKKFQCNDGFKLDTDTSRFLWNEGDYRPLDINDKFNLPLYKLHGSLNWKNHKKYGIERITSERKINDSNYDDDYLIYPSLSPKDGMYYQPYATIREKFKDILLKSDICIVIGFSFRDDHLNDIFKQFIDLNKKLLVISPGATAEVSKFLPLEEEVHIDAETGIFESTNFNIHGIEEYVSLNTIEYVAQYIEKQLE